MRQQAGDLRRARRGRERRVDRVDVERQEQRSVPRSLAHEPPVVGRGQRAQRVAGEDLEAPAARLGEVGGSIERPAHAGERRALGRQQPLLERAPERRPVEVALAVVLVPRVGVGVDQDEPERAVALGVRAQLPEHDRVVAAEHERGDPGGDQRPQPVVDLPRGALGVAGCHRKVAPVDERLAREHVDLERRMPRPQQQRARADRLGAEPCARPVARRGVERHADDRRVHAVRFGHVGKAGERADARVARRERGVGRAVARGHRRARLQCAG